MSKKAALILCVALCFGSVSSVFAQLDVSPPVSIDLLPPSGQTRTIDITITGNIGIVDAYGLTLNPPPWPLNLLFLNYPSLSTRLCNQTSPTKISLKLRLQ